MVVETTPSGYAAQEELERFNMFEVVAISTVLIILILACIIGNLFVILAILFERDLRNRPQYSLIFSLAVADLLVGLIVTPLYAWSTIAQAWKLGALLCDFWITTDVLLCTSSILHLVAIALDRYWSVTDIGYVQNRTPKRIFTMLGVVWVVSLVISVAPILGWKDHAEFNYRIEHKHACLISQELSYQVFSTATAFYIPLFAIIFVYYKIMRAAKKRFQRERDRKTIRKQESDPAVDKENEHKVLMHSSISASGNCTETRSAVLLTNGVDVRKKSICCSSEHTVSDEERTAIAANGDGGDYRTDEKVHKNLSAAIIHTEKPRGSAILTRFPRIIRKSKETTEMKRQRKAWRTLAIITGTFVASWTPFFLVAVYRPICNCEIPVIVERLTNWLGYFNSAINPIIYTIFSLDFRLAFQKLLKRMFFMGNRRRAGAFQDLASRRRS